VTVEFNDNTGLGYRIRLDADCPAKPEAPKDLDGYNAFQAYCQARDACLMKYFENPGNTKILQSELINLVRDLQIE
jgi:hypothetical protein